MAAQDRTSEEAEIRQLIDGFQRAIRAKDLSGVLSVYAPDIVSFDLGLVHLGQADTPICQPDKPALCRSPTREALCPRPGPSRRSAPRARAPSLCNVRNLIVWLHD
jgi:hypothetical protein